MRISRLKAKAVAPHLRELEEVVADAKFFMRKHPEFKEFDRKENLREVREDREEFERSGPILDNKRKAATQRQQNSRKRGKSPEADRSAARAAENRRERHRLTNTALKMEHYEHAHADASDFSCDVCFDEWQRDHEQNHHVYNADGFVVSKHCGIICRTWKLLGSQSRSVSRCSKPPAPHEAEHSAGRVADALARAELGLSLEDGSVPEAAFFWHLRAETDAMLLRDSAREENFVRLSGVEPQAHPLSASALRRAARRYDNEFGRLEYTDKRAAEKLRTLTQLPLFSRSALTRDDYWVQYILFPL
jgi:hypothetical protein